MKPHASGSGRRAAIFFCVLAACVGCDHASKRAAEALLADSGGISLAGDTLQFQIASNPGAFLSIGAELPEPVRHVLLLALVPLLLAFVCVSFARSARTTHGQWLALALVAGGGLGNWLDRVLHDGTVTDFVSIGLGGLRTGIFNLADLAVVAGVCLLLVTTGGLKLARRQPTQLGMQARQAGPETRKSSEKSSLGSALPLETLAADARSLAPELFAEKHGNAFLLFTAKRLDGPESTNSTKLLLGSDDVEPAGRTANLAVVVFPLRPRDTAKGNMITLGRETRQDVVIPDMSVSRFHAFAKPGPDGALLLQDAGSTNGTTVNGESVLTAAAGPPRRLKPGDNVRLGHIELTFTDARALRDFAARSR